MKLEKINATVVVVEQEGHRLLVLLNEFNVNSSEVYLHTPGSGKVRVNISVLLTVSLDDIQPMVSREKAKESR